MKPYAVKWGMSQLRKKLELQILQHDAIKAECWQLIGRVTMLGLTIDDRDARLTLLIALMQMSTIIENDNNWRETESIQELLSVLNEMAENLSAQRSIMQETINELGAYN